MLEFTANHHAIKIIDDALKIAVAKGVAECTKDSREGEARAEQYIKGEDKVKELKEENKDRNFGVVVYKEYMIRVSSGLTFMPHIADIRIWFDKHTGMAGIKISEESLIAIMQTTTVINLLHKLDVSLGGGKDGEITLDKVATLLTQTITKIAPDAKTVFTVQRINHRR